VALDRLSGLYHTKGRVTLSIHSGLTALLKYCERAA
jgi:hypothetical protein